MVTDATRGKVLNLTGATNGYAAFPTGLFDGRNQMTVRFDMRSDLASGNFFSFAFGQDSNKYYFFRTRGAEVRSAITQSSYQTESAVTAAVTTGQWHSYDLVFDGTKMTVYIDGAKAGENLALNTKVADLGTNLVGYLGRSLYSGDRYFQGAYDNIRIYGSALSEDDLLGKDQIVEPSLVDTSVLKTTPIRSSATKTVVFPVKPGTDVTALAPTFRVAAGVTVSPASGATVDLTNPVTYTLTAPDTSTATWTFSTRVQNSPVLPGLYADPNIAVFGDTYYIYATSDGYAGWGGKEFYVWKSKDLVSWERSAQPFLTLDGANGNVPWATGNAWAPTIIERGGKYYFYFSGHNGALNRKTIGVAVADSPEGPFVARPQAMILNDIAPTTGQAIDPAAFLDPVSGKYYLFWGNGNPPLYAELSDDMLSIKAGTIKSQSGLTNYREGSFINYRQGLYHMTYAIDDTGSENYRVGYATSTSIDGPWTYRGVILEKDPSQGILATGHSSIIQVPGTDEWYIAYHRFAMPNGNGNNRETTIDRLTFGTDGLIQKVIPTLTSVPARTVPAPAPTGVTVEPAATTVVSGSTVQLSATVAPAAALQSVTWTSSDVEVATVDADGLVSGVAAGTATITAASTVDATKTATTAVTVTPPACALTEFTDVPATHQFSAEISWLACAGVTQGWTTADGQEFRPAISVDRAAMAAMLYRLAGSPDFTAPAVSPFRDVRATGQFYKEIAWLADQEISTGWVTGTTAEFRPQASVSRSAMAAFLYRFARTQLDAGVFTPPATSPFTDVPTGNQFYREISWMAAEGISTGYGSGTARQFRTANEVDRQAMAAFMYRLVN